MGWVDLKEILLHSYPIERKQVNKWHMMLCHRLLNTLVYNDIIYRNNIWKRIDQLSLRIWLVEGLLVKYANLLECKVPGQHSSDNTEL
jgi:hypothetical protein